MKEVVENMIMDETGKDTSSNPLNASCLSHSLYPPHVAFLDRAQIICYPFIVAVQILSQHNSSFLLQLMVCG